MDPSRRRRQLVWALLASVFLTLAAVVATGEMYLRLTGRFATYWEINGESYVPKSAETLFEPFLWVHSKNLRGFYKKREYNQLYTSNAEGLHGPLLPLDKAKDEYRVIVVGDSFTEGVGALDGQGYVEILRRAFARRKFPPRVQVMNAGIAGSDPVFELELIRRKLLKYRPDLVLMTIDDTGISQVKRRGGLDRFTPQGTLKPSMPVWAPLFYHSRLVRAFVLGWLRYSWDLLSPPEEEKASRRAIDTLAEAAQAARELADANGFQLLILIHPEPDEILDRRLDDGLIELESRLRAAKIEYLDLLPEMLALLPGPFTQAYYWPLDEHFTSQGYEIFAHALQLELELGKRLQRRAGQLEEKSRPPIPVRS